MPVQQASSIYDPTFSNGKTLFLREPCLESMAPTTYPRLMLGLPSAFLPPPVHGELGSLKTRIHSASDRGITSRGVSSPFLVLRDQTPSSVLPPAT